MGEQVELFGGPLDGQRLNVMFSRDRKVWMWEIPTPGTAPRGLIRDASSYRPDPANPRRFVYTPEVTE